MNSIFIIEQSAFLCKHSLAQSKGNKIINTDHKRDKSQKLKELIADISAQFINPLLAAQFFELICEVKSRYLRDQVLSIRETIKGCNEQLANKVLEICVQERHLSAVIFSELITMHQQQELSNVLQSANAGSVGSIILLDPDNTLKAATKPDKSNLDNYEEVFKK